MLEVLSDLRSYRKSFQSIDGGMKGMGKGKLFPNCCWFSFAEHSRCSSWRNETVAYLVKLLPDYPRLRV